MADTPAFAVGAGFSISNFAVLVLGAIAGGALAMKFFKNGDVHLRSEEAMTNQDYIEDEVYNTMYATAAYPATVHENRDRILDIIRRYRVDVRNLVLQLRKKEITPTQFRGSLRSLGQEINSQMHIGQIGEIAHANRKAACEQRIAGAITRVQASRMPQATKDKLVANLTAHKARCR